MSLLAAIWALTLCLVSALPECKDEMSCKARLESLAQQLETTGNAMQGKHLTLRALEDLRTGILSGKRIEMPSAQRQHLERASPIISEVSFDVRHRPVSTNTSRHFQTLGVIAPHVEVRFHQFMQLKKPTHSIPGQVNPTALIIIIDAKSNLHIYTLEGLALLEDFELGHKSPVSLVELSPSQENYFVMTADESEVRVHDLKVIRKRVTDDSSNEREPSTEPSTENKTLTKTQLFVSTNFSCTFSLPQGPTGEARKLSAIIPMERGVSVNFVTADTLGGITVFLRNGTLKGRVRVTEDLGGVRGLLKSQGHMLLFYSSHSFGFFSISQIDVTHPPCTGWNSPLVQLISDPSYSSTRVLLALADGDILIFSTQKGKSKACDLSLKFPHVSPVPFKLYGFKGHAMALTSPLEDTHRKDEYLREIYFFSVGAMESGYGGNPSKALVLQATFKPKQPLDLAVHNGAPGTAGDRLKSQIAIRFAGVKGLELFDVTLKHSTPPPSAAVEGGEEGGASDWLSWLPKFSVFGFAVIAVIFWNVKKASSSPTTEARFDEDYVKEKLREKRMQRGPDDDGEGRSRGTKSRMEEIEARAAKLLGEDHDD